MNKRSRRMERLVERMLDRAMQDRTFAIGAVSNPDVSAGRSERWARTTTSTDLPTYPTMPTGSNPQVTRMVAEFGRYTFDDKTVGTGTASFTAYTPKTTRVIYSRFGWFPQNTIVRIWLSHGQWYVLPDETVTMHKGKTTSSVTTGNAVTVNIWQNGVVTSPVWSVRAHFNWMDGTSVTIASGKEVLIQWFQDEANGAGQWVITNADCA